MTKSSPSRATRKWSSKPNAAAAHKLVREVAVQMAHEAYAALMSRNEWYDALKLANPGVPGEWLEKGWVNAHWGEFIEGARATMAGMLAGPQDGPLKEQIAEALMLDATLTRVRASGAKIMGAHRAQ